MSYLNQSVSSIPDPLIIDNETVNNLLTVKDETVSGTLTVNDLEISSLTALKNVIIGTPTIPSGVNNAIVFANVNNNSVPSGTTILWSSTAGDLYAMNMTGLKFNLTYSNPFAQCFYESSHTITPHNNTAWFILNPDGVLYGANHFVSLPGYGIAAKYVGAAPRTMKIWYSVTFSQSSTTSNNYQFAIAQNATFDANGAFVSGAIDTWSSWSEITADPDDYYTVSGMQITTANMNNTFAIVAQYGTTDNIVISKAVIICDGFSKGSD